MQLKIQLVDLTEVHWNSADLREAVLSATQHPRPENTTIEPQIHRITQRLSQSDQQRIIDLYLSGLSSREVAHRFNIAKGSVLTLVRAAGHQAR